MEGEDQPARASVWPSACALVAANLLPLYGVHELKWPVYSVIALFWIELVIIGLVSVLGMAYQPVPGIFSRAGKLIALPFFCFGYGILMMFYGLMLAGAFGLDSYYHVFHGLLGVSTIAPPAAAPDFVAIVGYAFLGAVLALLQQVGSGWFAPVAICALAASHLHTFFRSSTTGRSGLLALTFGPFGWLALMQGIVVFGGAAAMSGESPVWAADLLIAAKTAVDLIRLFREWSRPGLPRPPSPC